MFDLCPIVFYNEFVSINKKTMIEKIKNLFRGKSELLEQEVKPSQISRVRKTLALSAVPVSSNYFVYKLGIARISGSIWKLRKKGYKIATIRKPNEHRATSYYCMCHPQLEDECKRNGWVIEFK